VDFDHELHIAISNLVLNKQHLCKSLKVTNQNSGDVIYNGSNWLNYNSNLLTRYLQTI